ncbi:MAG: hypothetical protein R2762_12875 [Bryobacteraceae bacterium]
MAAPDLIWKDGRFGQTTRRDAWWIEPLYIFLGLTAFIVYATWAAFQGEHYTFGPYLSPMYSPELFGSSHHAWFGPKPEWWPSFLPFSPALLILPVPALFRFTCYYYRGAYYKGFWADPLNCSVGEPRSGYRGEKLLPLVLHNAHRYVFYVAAAYIVILAYDALLATQFAEGFGIGVGTLVMTVNVCLLGSYTFGCHCARHLFGGSLDSISQAPVRQKLYKLVSWFNGRHKKFAWASLVWVGFTDFYIRMCSMGVWSDWRIL